MSSDNINDYLPSILNPRKVKKQLGEITLTQNSVVSRCSLSLKKSGKFNTGTEPKNIFPIDKENIQKTRNTISVRNSLKSTVIIPFEENEKEQSLGFSFTDDLAFATKPFPNNNQIDNIIKERSLNFSFTDDVAIAIKQLSNNKQIADFTKERSLHFSCSDDVAITTKQFPSNKIKDEEHSLNFSFIDDLTVASKQLINNKQKDNFTEQRSLDFSFIDDLANEQNKLSNTNKINDIKCPKISDVYPLNDNKYTETNNSIIIASSETELDENSENSSATIICDIEEKPIFSVSLGLLNCKDINLGTKSTNIKNILITTKNSDITLHCDVVESSQLSLESNFDENMDDNIKLSPTIRKRSVASVNLEIKKKKLSPNKDSTENSRVLIINSDAIKRFSHVIVQPPNYKLVKQTIANKNNLKNRLRRKSKFDSVCNNGERSDSDNLKQQSIDSYITKTNVLELKISDVRTLTNDESSINNCDPTEFVREDVLDMTKNSGVVDGIKVDRCIKGARKTNWKDYELSPKSTKVSSKRGNESPKIHDILEPSRTKSPKGRLDSVGSYSPRPTLDSVHFNVTPKPKSNKSPPAKNIPYFKIIAGTHFAVDAFSYGDIANINHYFLTHFHSDHYSGLRRNFNKLLFCSKITGDLCVSRLGVNPKFIRVLNVNETLEIDGVEVTPVDANHCPGAIMLVFTLPNGRSILHTGDFRASPAMESYPVFWNKDIHSIYLDTTYCNPRYDFPTQEESLEMALYLLRQKKTALEKVNKKFSSVLIVCGTYTIGKEKFFLGVARRVGCAVWACPEKDRVLQVVEGRSFSQAAPHACQLHVVPMRDLTYEKLRSYLESLQGAFSEVVAFKPSGWENGKNTTLEKDMITIHGIPYSEHSSFSELIRFVKFLKPKQVIPTVDISGGIKAVQKHFPCPLVCKQDIHNQTKVTDYFSIQNRPQVSAVT